MKLIKLHLYYSQFLEPHRNAIANFLFYLEIEKTSYVGVKFIPSLLLVFSKIKVRDIFAGGFLLSARFSLIIAMAEIGVHLDLITVELEQQIILLAVITATFSPILFRIFRSKTT